MSKVALRVNAYFGQDIRLPEQRGTIEQTWLRARAAKAQELADEALEALWHDKVRQNPKERRRIARIIGEPPGAPLPRVFKPQAF